MAITVVKNPKESPERLIGRFNKKVQQSRMIVALKAKRYRSKDLSERKERSAALMRTKYRKMREKSKFS
jgi:ribosomal protein S21